MRNPHQRAIHGLAVAPQAIGTSAVNGVTLVRPWEKGRLLTMIAIGGALVAADALTAKIQARRAGTSTWDDVLENDGSTVLSFTVSKLSDGGAVENGAVVGTLDLSRLKKGTNLDSAYEYDALRLNVVNANNTTPGIVGFAYVLDDLFSHPATDLDGNATEDDLYFKQTPHSA